MVKKTPTNPAPTPAARASAVAKLRSRIDLAVEELLGEAPRVQILVVDLTIAEPVQVAPLPLRATNSSGRHLHRDRYRVAVENLDVAVRQFREAAERTVTIEEAEESVGRGRPGRRNTKAADDE